MADSDHPSKDIDRLWDYQDPAGTRTQFHELLASHALKDDPAFRAEVLTQIARTHGLEQNFDAGHQTLDEADALTTDQTPRPRVRSLMERGRLHDSSGNPKQSIPFFEKALTLAKDTGLEPLAVDAAHMLGIVCEGDAALTWTEHALKLADEATHPDARAWRGTLYNNLGWTYHKGNRHEDALRMFEQSLQAETDAGHTKYIAIARWSIAKMQRFLGQPEQAIQTQEELLEGPDRQNNASEGYTREEIGECLLILGRNHEAAPHFARAWELLHTDRWLQRDEPDRLERLRRLGKA
ncbi:MAG: tetratricopeptide repeat protein [Planctomycetota bacterium]